MGLHYIVLGLSQISTNLHLKLTPANVIRPWLFWIMTLDHVLLQQVRRTASFKVIWVDLRPEKKNMLDVKEGHLEELGYKPFNESNSCATRVFLLFFLLGGDRNTVIPSTGWNLVIFGHVYHQIQSNGSTARIHVIQKTNIMICIIMMYNDDVNQVSTLCPHITFFQ